MAELVDIVSPATGEVVGTAERVDVHAQGLWHQVFHCLVLRPSDRTLVLQRRSHTKAAFPGLLDLSVTGHLAAGESPLDGLREFEEELGRPLDPDALIPLGTRLLADDNGEGQNRELVHVFFVLDDRPITDYRPPAEEVEGLVEVTADDFGIILADEQAQFDVRAIRATDPTELTTVRVSRGDLVDGTDGYWTVLASMAQRALDGEVLLAV